MDYRRAITSCHHSDTVAIILQVHVFKSRATAGAYYLRYYLLFKIRPANIARAHPPTDSPTPEFSTSSSKDLQQNSSPAGPLPTTASDLSSKILPPSSSTARSSSSLSSPSETALGNGTKGGGLGKTDIILAAVFGFLGFILIAALLILWIRHRKKRKQRGREPEPQNNVVSRRFNDDAPDLLTLRSDSPAHNRSSRDLRPQPRRNGELDYDVNSGQSSMPTLPQGHPSFPSSERMVS